MSEDVDHSPIGASGASRWFVCPGSVELTKISPPQSSNVHAERGTKAHEILENCFDEPKDPKEYLGASYPGGTVDDEDIHAVQEAIDWLDSKVRYLTKRYGGVKILKEVGFDLSNLHDELWGTSDIVIYTEDFSFLGVYDYKHGKSIVEAYENVQLLYYALGAINFIARKHIPTIGWGNVFRNVELGIIQPRVKRVRTESVRVWEPNHKRLDSFAIELKEKAEATEGSTEYFAGSHCYWCNAKVNCPQIYNDKLETAKDDFRKV